MPFPASRNLPGVAALFCLALAAASVAALHAASEARDLNADGSFYLLSAMSSGGLALFEPARRTVQLLQQSLSFAGYSLGITNLPMLGRLLTLGMQGWPILLTGLCWFALPRGEKNWILGPLINMAVVIPVTNFWGIGEGIIASCLMWLLFFLIEFDSPGRFRTMAAVVLAGACFAVHEAAFPFMFGIALLAGMRAKETHGLRRACLVLVVLLAIAAAIHSLYFVLYPRDATNRGRFLSDLLSDAWFARGVPNLLAFAGVAAGLCLVLVRIPAHYPEAQRQRLLLRASWWSIGFFAVAAALFMIIPQWIAILEWFAAARGLPILATTVMAGAIHLFRRGTGRPPDLLMPIPVRAVFLAITAMHLVIQTVLTTQWASYRRDLSNLVAMREGIIPWDKASAMLDPRHTFFRRTLVGHWSIQSLSIVLAPEEDVRSAVDAQPGAGFKPYRLDDPGTLPVCAKGLNWSHYLATLRYAGADPKAGCPK